MAVQNFKELHKKIVSGFTRCRNDKNLVQVTDTNNKIAIKLGVNNYKRKQSWFLLFSKIGQNMKDDNQEMIQITVLMILIFIHYPLFRCFHMFFLPCFYQLPKRSFCTGMAFKNCKIIQFLCDDLCE